MQQAILDRYYDGHRKQAIYESLKNDYPHILLSDVSKVINSQESFQEFKQANKPKHWFPITSNGIMEKVSCDLMDFRNMGKNQKYNWAFTLIDLYSKYAWVVLLKDKTGRSVSTAFRNVVEAIKETFHFPPVVLITDNESGLDKTAQKYADENNIHIRWTTPGDKNSTGNIESFNKFIRSQVNRGIESTGKKWYELIPDIVWGYNHILKHSAIGMTPYVALAHPINQHYEKYLDKRRTLAKSDYRNKSKMDLQVDDRCRLLINKALFQKGTEAKWTKTIHRVVRIVSPNAIYVNDRVHPLKRWQIQKITAEVQNNTEANKQAAKERAEERKEKRVENKIDNRLVRTGLPRLAKIPPPPTMEERNKRAIRRVNIRNQDVPYIQFDDYEDLF